MNKEDILAYINDTIMRQGQYYTYQNIPPQIGNAIYLYGHDQIYDIVIFMDLSQECDGSLGIIITSNYLYFQLKQKGYFAFQDIQSLSLEMHRHQERKGVIQTTTHTYQFDDQMIDVKAFLLAISTLTNIDINMVMTQHEKIEYNILMILHDIENDEYEDLEITDLQYQKMKEFYDNINIIQSLDDENYQYELETLCQQALQFFYELELDSDEIDDLIKIQKELHHKEDQSFEQAKQYYDDMMHQYQQGDTKMFDQLRSMMNMLGIHEDDFKDKSPEEMNQYIDDLCNRFGISRSQIDKLIEKFQK